MLSQGGIIRHITCVGGNEATVTTHSEIRAMVLCFDICLEYKVSDGAVE